MNYYKNNKPQINDLVLCKVVDINVLAFIVNLIEYNNIKGIVILADATKRKKRKSHFLMKKNKIYTLVVKNITDENVELSYKYVDPEKKKVFLNYIEKYQKSLKIYNYFLKNINQIDYKNKTILKIKNTELYDYIVAFYLQKNNLELFDLTLEEKQGFKNALIKFFGKLEIKSKYIFTLKNANYSGIKTLKKILDNISNKYDINIFIENIPQYYILITSENEDNNNIILQNIENDIISYTKKYKCIYLKNNIITKYNI